jgi:hypothetical protein
MRPSTKKSSPIEPQRVVDYLGQTTRHLFDDMQAETGSYYRTRSAARQENANVVTRIVSDSNTRVETSYETHVVNTSGKAGAQILHPPLGRLEDKIRINNT